MMNRTSVFIYLALAAIGNPASGDWNGPDNGNPLVPGYFADPSAYYDSTSKTFYIFSTTDGVWISFSGDPAAYFSTDFVHWKLKPLSLPGIWPKQPLWAPSVCKHPKNNKYYLLYAIGDGTYIASSDSPLGPWTNATAGETASSAALYRTGEMWGSSDWFDAQFFIDTNTVYMTFGGGGKCGIAKLAFDTGGRASIDNGDPRMTDGSAHKFKQLGGLTNYLEGSCMFKKDGNYFLTYSNSACQNYNVRFAVATSPLGPFAASSGIILQRSNADHILGPGHNSILEYNGSWYIVYHRQHYNYVDVKRQICIDRLTVGSGAISAGAQTQEGVWNGTGALESLVSVSRARSDTDVAFGKAVAASSESDYKGGTSGNISERFPAVAGFYAGRYAVDRNYGTRWAPNSLPGYLIVDMGADHPVQRCETTFEYVMRLYKYKIEFLTGAEAASLEAARGVAAWHMFADRSKNTETLSPVVDTGRAAARFIKITALSANLPAAQNEIRTIIETDYADRFGIAEFKVFQGGAVPARSDNSPGRGSKRPDCPTAAATVPLAIVNASGRTVRRSLISARQGISVADSDLKSCGVSPGVYFCVPGSAAPVRKAVNCMREATAAAKGRPREDLP